MDNIRQLEGLCREQGIPCGRDVPLGAKCSFRIGGPAALFAEPCSAAQVSLLLQKTAALDIPRLVLGKGSNVLFSDDGFPGAVICLGRNFSGIRLEEGRIVCESGAALAKLCEFACDNGLAGLEFAYGIPGTVGGAVYMNAGAYGGEMKDVLAAARHLYPDGSNGEFAGEDLGLGYRHSAYSGTGLVIVEAVFTLGQGDQAEIRGRMEDYMGRRKEKQPLEYPSAGSTFKRPPGAYASALIDQCGLKGLSVGGAQVSEKHAGFVINRGGATASDVLALMDQVRETVFRETGHTLEPEIKMIG